MATERVNISVKPEILAELDRLADDAGMDRSKFIELMVGAMQCLSKNDFKAMTTLVYKTLTSTMAKRLENK